MCSSDLTWMKRTKKPAGPRPRRSLPATASRRSPRRRSPAEPPSRAGRKALTVGGPPSAAAVTNTGGQPPVVPMPANWLSKELPFQALRINDTVFIAMPGEPVTALGFTMKQQAEDAALKGFVLSLANDHGGYFTTTAQFDVGTYEGTATLYGRGTGAKVLEQSALVVDKVK